jgi:hypothetical protein
VGEESLEGLKHAARPGYDLSKREDTAAVLNLWALHMKGPHPDDSTPADWLEGRFLGSFSEVID